MQEILAPRIVSVPWRSLSLIQRTAAGRHRGTPLVAHFVLYKKAIIFY